SNPFKQTEWITLQTAGARGPNMSTSCGSSRLYYPYRALGLVTDGVPFVLNRLGEASFVTVSTGHAFQILDAAHLRVVMGSPPIPDRVRCLAARGDKFTYVGTGHHVLSWRRLSCQGALGEHPGEVTHLLVLGHLIISACDGGRLRAWRLERRFFPRQGPMRTKAGESGAGGESSNGGGGGNLDGSAANNAAASSDSDDDDDDDKDSNVSSGNTEERRRRRRGGALSAMMTDIALPPGFVPSALVHPPTYLNKVVLGSTAGVLGLWNIRTGKRIHMFRCLDAANVPDLAAADAAAAAGSAAASAAVGAASSGTAKAGITALEPSPALDVAAVGLANGAVCLVNLRLDVLLFCFRQRGPVMALAFRTDVGAASLPMLASGASDGGRIHLWDLKERRLHHSMRCHEKPISALAFLPGEPVLLTASPDNALKMWVFDAADGTARLLRGREGHSAPPRRVRYVGGGIASAAAGGEGAEALAVLSAGEDQTFRLFHTVRDCLSAELSQKALLKVNRKHEVTREAARLRPVVAFASCDARARDWADVVTAHDHDPNCYVWSSERRAAGKFVLRQPHWTAGNAMMHAADPKTFALSVCVSAC
ncbi:unnamed protein product, partial [Phaeothamnion confervicola]